MSIIKTKGKLWYEKGLVDNYAYLYAKRESENILGKIDAHRSEAILDHPDASVTESKLADGAVTENKLAEGAVTESKLADYSITSEKLSDELMETIDMALSAGEEANVAVTLLKETVGKVSNTASSAMTAAESAQTAADAAQITADAAQLTADEAKTTAEQCDASKLDKTQYASIYHAGTIKLLSGSGGNRSGIVVSTDGTAYINTREDRGVKRDGSGQIGINPATEADVDEMTNEYKPITPNTLGRFISYSTAPQRVGTWVDGTPIWRMAIERTLDADEKASGYFDIREDITVWDSDTNIPGVYINSCFVSTYSDGLLGEGTVLKCTEPFYYSGVLSDHGKAYGWVEFATAEENLRT